MTRNVFSISLIACVVCLLPTPAVAMSSAELDSLRALFNLDEVEVVANYNPQSSILSPQSSQTLSGLALDALQPQSVADAIRYFSGVQVKDYGGVGGIKTIDVRSMGSQHVGVLYDGIEIGNAQNGTVDLGKFSMDNLAAVTLYHGQPTQELLSAKELTSASTVYLTTRQPSFKDGKTYNVSVGMKAGAFGLANPSIRYDQQLTKSLSLSAHAEYLFATGRYHFRRGVEEERSRGVGDTIAVRQNGEIQALRAELALMGSMPQGHYQLRGYYYASSRGIPRAIVRNAWASAEHQWDRNGFVQGSLDKTWCMGVEEEGSRVLKLKVKFKYANDYLRYLNPDTTTYAFDDSFTQQEAYASLALQYSIFSWWTIAASGDYQYDNLITNKYGMERVDRHSGYASLSTDIHYQWLSASLSGVFQYIDNRLQRQPAQRYNHLSPSATVGFQPLLSEQWYLRAMYKQSYRMPSFNDLYYGEVGISNLRPENAHQVELGSSYEKRITFSNSRHALRGITPRVGLTGFYNRITDKIVALPKSNTLFRWSMMNIGKVEDLGCEARIGLLLELPHEVDLDVEGSYTYQRAQDKTDPTDITYNGQIAYIPVHSGAAMARLSWHGLTFHYAFVYVGERYTGSVNSKKHHLDAWSTHDICVGYTWQFTKNPKKLYTGLEFNNLLNQQYEIIKNYPMPGFNGKCILRVDF